MENWYLIYNGSQVGPMTEEQLLAYHPTPDTMVWQEGMQEWQPLYTIPTLMQKLNNPHSGGSASGSAQPAGYSTNAHPSQVPNYNQSAHVAPKDKTAAGVLAILLGWLGIQYFYLGKVGGGFICLLLSIVTCGLWSIVTLIQGIMMLTMTQEEFNAKYVYSDSVFPLF